MIIRISPPALSLTAPDVPQFEEHMRLADVFNQACAKPMELTTFFAENRDRLVEAAADIHTSVTNGDDSSRLALEARKSLSWEWIARLRDECINAPQMSWRNDLIVDLLRHAYSSSYQVACDLAEAEDWLNAANLFFCSARQVAMLVDLVRYETTAPEEIARAIQEGMEMQVPKYLSGYLRAAEIYDNFAEPKYRTAAFGARLSAVRMLVDYRLPLTEVSGLRRSDRSERVPSFFAYDGEVYVREFRLRFFLRAARQLFLDGRSESTLTDEEDSLLSSCDFLSRRP